jgi:methylase of polypeptide subunit release factors
MIQAVQKEINTYKQLIAQTNGRVISEVGFQIYCIAGVLPPANRVSRCFGEVLKNQHASRVLDLGCGSGILSLITSCFAEYVLAIDNDWRAIQNARANARVNKIHNIDFLCTDALQSLHGIRFDLIVCNPPFYTGAGLIDPPKAMCSANISPLLYHLITGMKDFLTENGRTMFVSSSLSDNAAIEVLIRQNNLIYKKSLLHQGINDSQDIYLWVLVNR